jgi:hypothetical protein
MAVLNLGNLLIGVVLGLLSRPSQSQGLTLFQDDALNNVRDQLLIEALPPGGAMALPGGPVFVLKGIYRFGDEYHVSLQVADGVMQRVTWQADGNDSVPVANGYLIDELTARDVTFELPAGTDCQQSRQTGASCVGRSQMVLSFSETAPAQAAVVAEAGVVAAVLERPLSKIRRRDIHDHAAIDHHAGFPGGAAQASFPSL